MSQATTLKPGQIRHLLRVTEATSRHPKRDCLILLLGITCGMRVTEIAQIEVQDVLFPSGTIRSEVSLRAGHASVPLMDSAISLETNDIRFFDLSIDVSV